MSTNKRNLRDFTFLFSFRIDSPDRMENLFATLRFLSLNFNSTFLLLEAGPQQQLSNAAVSILGANFYYSYCEDHRHFFYRTYYNNQLIQQVHTPYYLLYDADIIIPGAQLERAAAMMRENKATAVYPYDGRFYETDIFLRKLFINTGNESCLEKYVDYHRLSFSKSYGGVVMLNKSGYEACGQENLRIRGWGPDDIERVRRLRILGHKIERVDGPLYHLFHQRNQFSLPQYCSDNQKEYLKVCAMHKPQLV
ncbi:galactosyltransferase-related protein [Pedobacter sp. BG31]|uniref:galactosyltransferase-related protein n=1 Tax=Pedobacter sp. BG31 TaxID=3349697 RepID=UPI0035F403B2